MEKHSLTARSTGAGCSSGLTTSRGTDSAGSSSVMAFSLTTGLQIFTFTSDKYFETFTMGKLDLAIWLQCLMNLSTAMGACTGVSFLS